MARRLDGNQAMGNQGPQGVRRARREGQRAVEAGAWGAEVAVEGVAPGVSVSGRVARCAAAGPEGRYSGPRWPQPAMAAALAARTSVLTRIWDAFNMRKL